MWPLAMYSCFFYARNCRPTSDARGWRLIPIRTPETKAGKLFDIRDYIAEVLVPKNSGLSGRSIDDLLADRIKTDHLNFSNLIIEKNIKINKENFKKDDPASHLEPNFYSTFFIKEITKRILKYIDK